MSVNNCLVTSGKFNNGKLAVIHLFYHFIDFGAKKLIRIVIIYILNRKKKTLTVQLKI